MTIQGHGTSNPKTNKKSSLSFAEAAHAAIEQHFSYALTFLEGVRADSDIENLHQLRVGLRRLRTAVEVFTPAIQLHAHSGTRRIGKIMRVLGTVRDYDVMGTELREKIAPLLGQAENARLEKVLQKLDRGRADSFAAMTQMFEGQLFRQFQKAYAKWLKKPSFRRLGNLPAEEVAPDILQPLLSEFLLHEGWLFGAEFKGHRVHLRTQLEHRIVRNLLEHHSEPMHDLRKLIKKVRYQAEVFSALYGEEFRRWLGDLKQAQEVLGAFQDIEVLRHFLLSHYGKDWEKDLPGVKQHARQERLRTWSEWNKLQTHYLNPQNRQELRQMLVLATHLVVRSKNKSAAHKTVSGTRNVIVLHPGGAD